VERHKMLRILMPPKMSYEPPRMGNPPARLRHGWIFSETLLASPAMLLGFSFKSLPYPFDFLSPSWDIFVDGDFKKFIND
jgi:hypothetical protein